MSASALGAARTAQLRTGRAIRITVAEPCDLATVQAFYEHLDDASTYTRFFGIRRHIPVTELRAAVAGSDAHVTLLAWSERELVGIGEYIVTGDAGDAEVAFAVADDHHREGIATLLLERLAVIAHERGLMRFTAMVLPDNHDMRLVFRTVGLTAHTAYDDGTVLITLDLSSVVAMLAAADARARTAQRSATAAAVR